MTKNLFFSSIRFFALFMLCFAIGMTSVMAQSTVTGAIRGKVADPNGAVLPNATVTVTNMGTNKVDTTNTDGDGAFEVRNLQPGTYSVKVASGGFAEFTREGIIVAVGVATPVDIALGVAGTSAEVNVTSEAPVVNTSDHANASNFDQTQINELPINGRRWSNFALLSPSAVPDGTFGLISFRGVSGLLNNNTIDGGDNNQAFFSEERGRTRINYSISQSAIREFQVNTSNYSAEYGRSAGGVTNAVTKSGTNEFHGDLFYYNRNNRNGARNPLQFRPIAGGGRAAAKPKDLRQQWGGTIGGPIVKDKLFFFFSYDQQSRNFPGVANAQTPEFFNPINVVLPANCTPGPGNTLTTGQLLACRGVSQAQVNSTQAFLLSLTGEVPRKGDQTLFLPKIDWHINDSNVFSISYNRLRWESPNGIQTQAVNTRGIDNFGDDFVEIDSINARLSSTINPNLVNEFRMQYGRDFESQISSAPAPGTPLTAFNNTKTPNIFITGGFEFGVPTFLERGAFPDEKRWQFANTMTYIRGRHTFKFGADINYVSDDISNLRFEGGSYSYTGNQPLGDFIIDYTNWKTPGALPGTTNCLGTATRFIGRCYNGNYQQGTGSAGIKISTWDYNFFFQDDFRVTSRVTVNLGLRYEAIAMPETPLVNANASGPLAASVLIPNDGRTIGVATSQLPKDNNNFGPRVGVAWDITGDGKTSLRTGWGIYYGRIQSSTIYNAIVNTGNPGGQSQVSISPGLTTGCFPVVPSATNPCAPVFPLLLNAATLPPQAGAIQFFDREFQAPLIYQYDAVFERQIMRNTAVSVSYIGSKGRHLPTFFDLNNQRSGIATYSVTGGPFGGTSFSVPTYTRVPGYNNSAFTRIQSTVKSDYNALVFQANRRLTDGLQVLASYTLAKSTDTNQNSATFTQTNSPFDIFDRSYDNGPSNFDTRHKVVLSGVWAPTIYKGDKSSAWHYILNGWTFSPNFNYYSGRPLNPTINGTSLNNQFGDNIFPPAGRNSFRLPGLVNLDARLSKRFKFGESMALEFLAEAFNVVNRTHVFQQENRLYTRSGTNLTYNGPGSPIVFGTTTGTDSTLYRERQIQFAARFQF